MFFLNVLPSFLLPSNTHNITHHTVLRVVVYIWIRILCPSVKLEELYDPCSVATVGHDWPQRRPQKQMKILAGQQGSQLFLCMVNK